MNFHTTQRQWWAGRTLSGLLVLLVVAAGARADSESVINPRGVEAMFSIATWAGEQGLDEHADELHPRVLSRDGDHEGARRAMRQVRLRGRWVPVDEAVTACAESIADGEADDAVVACLDDLLTLALAPQRRLQIRQMQAFAAVCRRQFDVAAEAMAELAQAIDDHQRPRLEAAAELLTEHPDGLYLITEEHLITAALLGDTEAAMPPGSCSLADPTVLRIALRDKAGDAIYGGVRMLKLARQTRATDAARAEKLCIAARGNFEWADAVTPDLARSYRVEAARLQIEMIRTRIEAGAVQFDAELTAIGREDMTVDDYLVRLRRMAGCLQTVRGDLDTILQLADPYSEEFGVAMRWARTDRQRIGRMQNTLTRELDESR